MQRFAIREDIGFCELVKTVNEQLNDEHREKDRGDLEEKREVDPVSVARPHPRHTCGAECASHRAGDDIHGANLEQ